MSSALVDNIHCSLTPTRPTTSHCAGPHYSPSQDRAGPRYSPLHDRAAPHRTALHHAGPCCTTLLPIAGPRWTALHHYSPLQDRAGPRCTTTPHCRTALDRAGAGPCCSRSPTRPLLLHHTHVGLPAGPRKSPLLRVPEPRCALLPAPTLTYHIANVLSNGCILV